MEVQKIMSLAIREYVDIRVRLRGRVRCVEVRRTTHSSIPRRRIERARKQHKNVSGNYLSGREKEMKGRWPYASDGSPRVMGVDVPFRNGPQRFAFAIILAGLITVPLIPFIESPTSIWSRWVGAGFLASVVVANVLLACFVRRLARSTAKPAAYEFELVPSLDPGRQNPRSDSHSDPNVARVGPKLADLMALIAAIAVGIVLVTSFLTDTHSLNGADREWGWAQLEGVYASVLMLMALTVGLALSWVGRLRWPLPLLSQSPGVIACLLASVVLIAVGYHLATNYAAE